MAGRLWFRLLIGTCLVLAVTLGAVILLVNKALIGGFQDYVEDQQSARVQRAESILSRYYDRRREWTGVEGTVQSVADLMGERLVLADAQGLILADSATAWSDRWPATIGAADGSRYVRRSSPSARSTSRRRASISRRSIRARRPS